MKTTDTSKPAAFKRFLIMAALGLSLGMLPRPAMAQNPNPGVLPPNSAPQGLTYGEWSARWVKWAYEATTANSPLLDTTGANCGYGQSGHVWFLAGTFNSGTAIRDCRIPPGEMLFFPVGNGFCAGDGLDFAGERDCATQFAAGLSNLRVEVDGIALKSLNAPLTDNYYRALSPPYDLVLGADNIFGAPAGSYTPGAADGVYIMLAPLSPGFHTIHIHADTSDGKAIDVTYRLTIGN
jgi:hypothetical protein